MIYLTYLFGPHNRRKRNVTNANPKIVFLNILKFGWGWDIDYSKATRALDFDKLRKLGLIKRKGKGRATYYTFE